MPFIALDDFSAPLQWAARDPLSAPSAEIFLSAIDEGHPRAQSPGAMRAYIGANASGHMLRRDIAAQDLSDFDDRALWMRSRSHAGTTPDAEFLLRLELGSAAMPIGSPGNDWHRYLTPLGGDDWHYLRFALDDLSAAVRSALTSLRITIVATQAAQVVHFDALEAQTRRTAVDTDAALLAVLDGQLAIGGNPVPAAILPDSVANPALPFFRIVPLRASPDPARALNAGGRTDYTAQGFRLRPAPEPVELFYALACEAGSRSDQARMQDHLSESFQMHGWLRSGNRAFRAEPVDPSIALTSGELTDFDCFLRVSTWVDRGLGSMVVPANDASLALEIRIPASQGGAG